MKDEGSLEPLPLETLVRYDGSLEGHDGLYRVWGHQDPINLHGCSPEELAKYFPDGVAYTLWPEGVPRKFGLRHLAPYNIRRKSLTVVEPFS